MAFARGPLQLIEPGAFDLTVEDTAFESLWLEHDQSFLGTDRALEVLALDTSSGADDDWAAALAEPMDSAGSAVEDESAAAQNMTADDLAQAHEDFIGQLQDAMSVLPGEVWQEFPPGYEPPAQLGDFVITGQPTTTTPTPGQTGTDPGQTPQYHAMVQMVNSTNPQQTHFSIGDHWAITVWGPPFSEVYVDGSHDKDTLSHSLVGMTNSDGYFYLWGSMTAAEQGEWWETWSVGEWTANPVLHFWVY